MAEHKTNTKTQPGIQGGSALISPYYHAARNEIVRPDQAVPTSRYFTRNWVHRLGPTGAAIVMCMRELAGEVRTGEVAIHVSQAHIASLVGCSVRTLQREIASNEALGSFLRMEERFVRGESGHVRQIESVYLVAMDDPLAPGDEERLAEIIARKTTQEEELRKDPTKVILREADIRNFPAREENKAPSVVRQIDGQWQSDVVRQSVVLRKATLSDRLSPQNLAASDCRTESESLNPTYRIDSVTRPSGPTAETSGVVSTFLEEWRRTNEDLARHSAQELDDQNSVGYHIKVWNHARKHDRARSGKPILTDGVFDILRVLSQRRTSTGQAQGRAFTRRTKKWFLDNGVPMQGDAAGESFDPEELAQVRAAIAEAPFMKQASLPQGNED